MYIYINFNFNRASESNVSSEISLNQKCIFNIFVSTIYIHIIQKALKFYLYVYIYIYIYIYTEREIDIDIYMPLKAKHSKFF